MALGSLLRVDRNFYRLERKRPQFGDNQETRERYFDKKFIGNDVAFNSGDGDIWGMRKSAELCFLGARALPALLSASGKRIPNSHFPHPRMLPPLLRFAVFQLPVPLSPSIHPAVLLTGERIEAHQGLPSNLNHL